MNHYLFFYIVASISAMVIQATILAWEDYDIKYINTYQQSTAKFGYNYSEDGLWWLIIGVWTPFVNILVVVWLLYGWVSIKYDDYVKSLNNQREQT